jgi:hypothetical protein
MITLMTIRLMPDRRSMPKVIAWVAAFAMSLAMWAGLIAMARSVAMLLL